ncbi:MAG TPA: Xaa-Pro dipeptidase [Clostridiales bacterium]|nr:Xaa-Pro dipeptidase [Clostridiales bacterium]
MNDRFILRLAALRAVIAQTGLDGLYVTGEANVTYLTGKNGKDCALWITDQDAFILTDFRYKEMALELREVFTYQEIKVGMDACDFFLSMNKLRIGVEKNNLSLSEYLTLLDRMEADRIVPVEGLVEGLREVKDALELDATKRACAIADACFAHMCQFLKPGVTERQAALEIEFFMKSNGAEELSFDTICVSGANTSYPHGIPGTKAIEAGDFVTMDYGCKVDGYCSDMTRTVAIGHVSEEMKSVYELVLLAQQTACKGIRAGMRCEDADWLARDVIREAGYGEYFGHGLGHGTGLQIHEAPRLRPGYLGELKENQIVSIEPGIYLPKKFGVRIEDLATVTAFGIINFVSSPKNLIIL